MLVLGIETSGLEGSIALFRDQACLGERRLNQAGRRHAQSLVLEIGDLLKSHGLVSCDVETVAVSRGPGSFTGLRVGMVCAKTFAYATGCQFIAIDTFAAIAENGPQELDQILVIEDAQREDLFVGQYHRHPSTGWEQVSPIRIIPAAEFLVDRSTTDVVTGPGLKKLDPSTIPANWLTDPAYCQPRAFTIAQLGERRMMSGLGGLPENDTNFWTAQPFYLRLSAAEEKRAAADAQAATK